MEVMSESKPSKMQSETPVSSLDTKSAAPTVRRGLGRGGSIAARFQAPESLTRQIEEAQQTLEQINQSIYDAEHQIKQKTFERDQFANTEKLIQKEIAELEKKQEKLRQAISSASQSAKSIAIKRDALEKELENTKKALPRRVGGGSEDQVSAIDSAIKKLEFERQTNTLAADREKQINQEIAKLREAKISFAHFEERSEQLRKLRRDIDRFDGESEKAKLELKDLDAEHEKLSKERDEIVAKSRAVEAERQTLQQKVDGLKAKIKDSSRSMRSAMEKIQQEKQQHYESGSQTASAPTKDPSMPKMSEILTDKSTKYLLDRATASTAKHQQAVQQQEKKQLQQSGKVPYADEIAICKKLDQSLRTLQSKYLPKKKAQKPAKERTEPDALETPASSESSTAPETPLPRFSLEKLLEFERVSVAAPATVGDLAASCEQLRLRQEWFRMLQERKTGIFSAKIKAEEKQAKKEKARLKAEAEAEAAKAKSESDQKPQPVSESPIFVKPDATSGESQQAEVSEPHPAAVTQAAEPATEPTNSPVEAATSASPSAESIPAADAPTESSESAAAADASAESSDKATAHVPAEPESIAEITSS